MPAFELCWHYCRSCGEDWNHQVSQTANVEDLYFETCAFCRLNGATAPVAVSVRPVPVVQDDEDFEADDFEFPLLLPELVRGRDD